MTDEEKLRIKKMIPELKAYRTINEIVDVARHFLDNSVPTDGAKLLLQNKDTIVYLQSLIDRVDFKNFQSSFKEELSKDGKKLKDYYPTLRAMLIGMEHGVSIGKIIEVFGEPWVLAKVKSF